MIEVASFHEVKVHINEATCWHEIYSKDWALNEARSFRGSSSRNARWRERMPCSSTFEFAETSIPTMVLGVRCTSKKTPGLDCGALCTCWGRRLPTKKKRSGAEGGHTLLLTARFVILDTFFALQFAYPLLEALTSAVDHAKLSHLFVDNQRVRVATTAMPRMLILLLLEIFDLFLKLFAR